MRWVSKVYAAAQPPNRSALWVLEVSSLVFLTGAHCAVSWYNFGAVSPAGGRPVSLSMQRYICVCHEDHLYYMLITGDWFNYFVNFSTRCTSPENSYILRACPAS